VTADLPPRILEWAGRPGAQRLLAAAREKVEAGTGRRGSLGDLTDAERRDVRALLGVHWEASGRGATLGELRDALARHGVELEDLLVHAGGPLRDRPRERRERAASRADDTTAALEVLARALPRAASSEALRDDVRAVLLRRCLPPAGGGARLARATDLVALLAVLPDVVLGAGGEPPASRTPDAGPTEPVLLAVLAARCFGDAHALDQSRPLGRSAARLVALLGAIAEVDEGDPAPSLSWVDPLGSAEQWRAAWAGIGVVCDSVSSQVLTLNLALEGTAPAVALTRAAAGEPLWLTARSLGGGTLAPVESATEVFVCENPSVVEAAATRLGAASAPLVCTYGRPGLACLLLLRAYAAAGTRVRVRADGDSAGRDIVRTVRAEVPDAVLWRMDDSTEAYEEELLDDLIRDLDRRGR